MPHSMQSTTDAYHGSWIRRLHLERQYCAKMGVVAVTTIDVAYMKQTVDSAECYELCEVMMCL